MLSKNIYSKIQTRTPGILITFASAALFLFFSADFATLNPSYATAEETHTIEVITPDAWGVDTYLTQTDLTYKQVRRIQIVRLSINPDFAYSDNEELARAIYYHYVFKLGFNEPIVNTVITPDQAVYQLTRSPDSQVAHTNEAGTLVIGLLTTSGELPDYTAALSEYLISVCSYYSVPTTEITASDFTLNASSSPTITLTSTASADFQAFVTTISSSISSQIVPKPPVIALAENNETISISVNPGQEDTVEIPFTNEGEVPIYGGESSSILMKSGARNRSVFYASDWNTPLIGGRITEERIGPLESGTMTLTVKAPLVSGERSETFTFVTSSTSAVPDATVTLTITTNDIGQKVLQIQDTGTGYLNVRSSPSAYGKIIDTVAISNIYLFDQADSGYYHIINGDKSGWVSSRYIKVLEN